MELYDVTMTISESMQVYKNKDEKRPEISITRDFDTSNARESRLSLDLHTGTHMDMPLHFFQNGESLEHLDLNRLITPCRVLDFTHLNQGISKDDLEEKDLKGVSFVLFKTRNSFEEAFNPDFIYLKRDGAAYIRDLGMDGVGIDALGIERSQPDYATHKILLENNILILEGLRLAHVEEGDYRMLALPLKIKGVEASPLRVVLIRD